MMKNKIDELILFNHVSAIIENRKFKAQAQANQQSVLIFGKSENTLTLFYLAENVPDMVRRLL